MPVVVVGAQRPASALSTDAGLNLVNAVRVAASPEARGLGVLVVLNDEIQAAREVTKTSTLRMQTFRTPDFGVLGHADGDAVAFYRRPLRRCYAGHRVRHPRAGRAAAGRHRLAYAGADGTAVRAFVAAGARGIVSAGFAPGFAPPGDFAALKEAAAQGVVVVQSTRAGSGRTFRGTRLRKAGFLIADNLKPQKARILLALALTVTRTRRRSRACSAPTDAARRHGQADQPVRQPACMTVRAKIADTTGAPFKEEEDNDPPRLDCGPRPAATSRRCWPN